MKILVGVNVLTSVESGPYGNHCKFWYELGKLQKDLFLEPIFMTPPRMSIDRMRNECARIALYNECDYLMFIDDDVILPPNCFETLLTRFDPNVGLVAGLVHIRSYPFKPMIFKKYRDEQDRIVLKTFDDFKDYQDSLGLVECDAVGFSCCLIDCKVLKALRPPYFITGTYNTEDIYFCCKVQDNLPGVKILCNTNIKCGHLGDKNIIHPDNIERMKELEKAYYPEGALDKTSKRDETYLETLVAAL